MHHNFHLYIRNSSQTNLLGRMFTNAGEGEIVDSYCRAYGFLFLVELTTESGSETLTSSDELKMRRFLHTRRISFLAFRLQ